MKNRILSVLVIIACLAAFTGCGGNKNSGVKKEGGVTTYKADKTEIKYSDDTKKSVPLPDNYPAELFPVYKNSFVAAVQSDENGVIVNAFSKDDVGTVAAFYKKVLKDAQVISSHEDSKGFASLGVMGGYTYNLAVVESNEMEGYRTHTVIMLMPAEEGMEETLKQIQGAGKGS